MLESCKLRYFNSFEFLTIRETKFHDVLLAFAVARWWPDVFSNSLEPGWVPTKMGGPEAPDNLEEGYATQVWLAVSNNRRALVSGEYFYHRKRRAPSPQLASQPPRICCYRNARRSREYALVDRLALEDPS